MIVAYRRLATPPGFSPPAGTLRNAVKRFHVTTFGCQMNEHDSERMKGMLESLGYSEAPAREDADLILFNTCSIREKADSRFVAHLHDAKALKRKDPERVIGVGGCWAQSVKDDVFRQFPFVDVAFGPGQVHKLAEFITSDSLTAQGYFEFEGFTGRLPGKRAREFQGWVQISAGLQHGLRVLHRPVHARAARCRGRWTSWSPRSSGSRPTASARSRCSARTSTRTAAACARERASRSCSARSPPSTASTASATRARTRRT